jgi:hypothetical protein
VWSLSRISIGIGAAVSPDLDEYSAPALTNRVRTRHPPSPKKVVQILRNASFRRRACRGRRPVGARQSISNRRPRSVTELPGNRANRLHTSRPSSPKKSCKSTLIRGFAKPAESRRVRPAIPSRALLVCNDHGAQPCVTVQTNTAGGELTRWVASRSTTPRARPPGGHAFARVDEVW